MLERLIPGREIIIIAVVIIIICVSVFKNYVPKELMRVCVCFCAATADPFRTISVWTPLYFG